MTESEALVASIRTRVGQIRKEQERPTADSWLKIELACDKLIEAADSFERASTMKNNRGQGTHDRSN